MGAAFGCLTLSDNHREQRMKGYLSTITVALTLLILELGVAMAAPVMDMPVTAFSTLPEYQNVQLSPDGERVAYIHNTTVNNEAKAILQVYDFGKKKPFYLLQSDNQKVKINWYKWANKDTLAVSARYEIKRRGQRFYRTQMFLINYLKADGRPRPVVDVSRLLQMGKINHVPQFLDTVVDWLVDDPHHILMAMDMETPNLPSVYKVALDTRKMTRIERAKRKIRTWMTDRQGRLRIGITNDYDTGARRVLIKKEGDWIPLFTYNAMNEKGFYPQGFGVDPDVLYYSAYQGDHLALYKMRLSTQESTLVFSDDHYDVAGRLLYSNKTNDAIGISHDQAPGGKHYWDNRWSSLQAKVNEAMTGFDNYLISFSQDETRYVLYSEADGRSPYYSVGDTRNNKLTVLFNQYPQLQSTTFPQHQKHSITTRDKLKIEAYLTLPEHGSAPYPTIIHPHGGPGARDYAGFDYWTAYFTSRGYAVLRPNFRGSSGYGFSFSRAQMKGWGLAMQDDITDATQWMIDEGLADANKLCIVGASYGGYAAMMATVKTPELFNCAISFAGVANLKALVSSSRRTLTYNYIKNQLGSDSTDLKARSPYYAADAITTALLLVHGDEDRSVPVSQSRDMAEELEDSGHDDFRYVELENGDHYLSIQKNRHRLFAEMDQFLATYLR